MCRNFRAAPSEGLDLTSSRRSIPDQVFQKEQHETGDRAGPPTICLPQQCLHGLGHMCTMSEDDETHCSV